MGFVIKIDEGVFVRDIENMELKLCSQLADAKVFDSIGAAAKCISGAGVDVNDCSIININATQMSKFLANDIFGESSVFGSAKESHAENGLITFERLGELCEEGSADLILKLGDKLENGYIVVAVKPYAVKVWSADNFLADKNWQEAKQAAADFYKELNNFDLPVEAISSELLSKEEVETLAIEDRTTGFYYWTATVDSSGSHWFVNYAGSLTRLSDDFSFACCPGIWVTAGESRNDVKKDDVITFDRLNELCKEGLANSKLKPGDKVKNGYTIVAVKPDAVKIWSAKDCLGEMNWSSAKFNAGNYAAIWNSDNSELTVVASRSELLSKEEAESLSQGNRTTGFNYWTSAENNYGYHWIVDYDGCLGYDSDSHSHGCCPGIWVRSRKPSKGSSENNDVITFERLHEICKEGSADLILKPGDKVENDYVVVAVESDTVKIWSPKDWLGNMNWSSANSNADNYAVTWNSDYSELTVVASKSELLSKEEAEGLSQGNRMTGFNYWTSTEKSYGYHWIVDYDGDLNYGYDSDSYSHGCCPGIWVK